MLGLLARIRELHLVGEMSAAVMGGCIQISAEVLDTDVKAKLLRIFTAILVAAISGALWHQLWGPLRDSYFVSRHWIQASPATSSATTPTPPPLWMRIKFLAILSFLSGGNLQHHLHN